jgi:hypothetical protein
MSLGQARLPRCFDPDEHGREIGVAEQAQQLVIADNINAELGEERQGPVLPG